MTLTKTSQVITDKPRNVISHKHWGKVYDAGQLSRICGRRES